MFIALLGAGSADAAITYHGASQATATAAHSVTVATPAGVQPGDVMIATVAAGGPRIALQATGWTPVRTTDGGPALDQFSFYRVVTDGEPAAQTFAAPSGSDDIAAGIAAYRGVDAANPIDAVADLKGAAAVAVPSVTASAPNAVVVGAIAVASTATVTPDATIAVRYAPSLPKAGVTGGDFAQPGAGATGDRAFTTSGKGEKTVQAIALRAASLPTNSGGGTTSGWTLATGQPLTPELIAMLPHVAAAHTPRVTAAGAVPVRVACPVAAVQGCVGTAALSPAKGVTAARRGRRKLTRRFKLAAGKRVTLAVRLDRRTARRLTRRHRAVKMTLRVAVQTSAGEAVKLTSLTVRERRTPRRPPPRRRR
jgi:hypothetical protein